MQEHVQVQVQPQVHTYTSTRTSTRRGTGESTSTDSKNKINNNARNAGALSPMERASRSFVRQVSGHHFFVDVNTRNPLSAKIKIKSFIFKSHFLCDVNLLTPLLAKNRGNKKILKSQFLCDVNARNLRFLKSSLCCLLFCLYSPAGARHRPPGHPISPSFSP